MKDFPFKRILAVGAHCDDIEIGCGGTLHRLQKVGIPTFGLVITNTHYLRNGIVHRDGKTARRESEEAAKIIGYEPAFGDRQNNELAVDNELVYLIRGYIEKHNIDTVFSHWDLDSHLDHVRVAQATIMATRDTRNLLMYRSNRFKTTTPFNPNFSVDISDSWEAKKAALLCYKSEQARVGGEFLEIVEQWNRLDGIATGVRYSEPFSCVKCVI